MTCHHYRHVVRYMDLVFLIKIIPQCIGRFMRIRTGYRAVFKRRLSSIIAYKPYASK